MGNMKDMNFYINKMNSYIETKNYDAFLKEMDCNNEQYNCFKSFYNKINEVSIKDILTQVIKEKLAPLDLKLNLKHCYCLTDWPELMYGGLVFGQMKIEEKKIKIYHRELEEIKSYLSHISYSLSVIQDQVSHKFKKVQEDEIKKHLNHIQWCCERLSLPNNEWIFVEKNLCNQFEPLGFEIQISKE